jgi:hypothetical protein
MLQFYEFVTMSFAGSVLQFWEQAEHKFRFEQTCERVSCETLTHVRILVQDPTVGCLPINLLGQTASETHFFSVYLYDFVLNS